MTSSKLAGVEATLVRSAAGRFTEADVADLPSPVRRFLRAAISPGTPLAATARIRMRGRIKIGRWIPFRAREVLTPHVGFIWAARAAGLISGYDYYADGRGGMNWRLAGLVQVMHAEGPDVSRSAAERAAAEAMWVPTALLPLFGVQWTAEDNTHITARYRIDGRPIGVRYGLTPDGHIQSVVFDRWGDPNGTGTFDLHPFGGEFTNHTTLDGVTIPSAGRVGWHYGTDEWGGGEFFRYRITNLELVADPAI